MTRLLLILTLVILLPACSSNTIDVHKLATKAQFEHQLIESKPYALTAYIKRKNPHSPLTVYIEGDGNAYLQNGWVSPDPTPLKAVALELAMQDPSSNVAYLARPCQYGAKVHDSACENRDIWTKERFSKEALQSMNQAINRLKTSPSQRVHLIGFSGGGALAVLLAAKRADVKSLRTVAGNLDVHGVNRHHKVAAMPSALSPIDYAREIRNMPQRHFIGEGDNVVPPFIAEKFLKEQGSGACSALTYAKNTAHAKGWKDQWEALLALPLPCQQ